MITVKCECGAELGRFEVYEDHGAVRMECPRCKGVVTIHNDHLSDVANNPSHPTIVLTPIWIIK